MAVKRTVNSFKILAKGLNALAGILKGMVTALSTSSQLESAFFAIENLHPCLFAILPTLLVFALLCGLNGFKTNIHNLAAQLPRILLSLTSPSMTKDAVVGVERSVVEILPTPPASAQANPARRKPVVTPATPSVTLSRGLRPLRRTSLEYPSEAKNNYVYGVVDVKIAIAEDGSVHDPLILSGDPRLHANLVEEIKRWLYEPLRIDGKAVPMTTRLTINFSLD
jgi:TonB family protein